MNRYLFFQERGFGLIRKWHSVNEYWYISLKKRILRIILTVLFFSFFFLSRSHPGYKYSPASFAEKIYLQLDGKVYTTDKTIWFKAVVTNAVDHTPTTLSRVLHVELIGPDERIVEKKLIKIEEGIGEGFFDLNQSYSEGLYQVRAYTEWNKNFGDDFFFKEYIRVFSSSTKPKAEPIREVVLTEKPDKERHLNALFDPLSVDSLHKKELTVFITLDGKKDSLLIKKGKDNHYLLDYDLPGGCQFVTLEMQTKNSLGYSKTIALREDSLDLQFLPESGGLVNGLPGKIGFKALDYNGKGKKVEGEIVDKNGEVITTFESNELGMGSFVLTKADSSAIYYARVKTETGERRTETGEGRKENGAEGSERSSASLCSMPHALCPLCPLPKAVRSGNILSVNRLRDEIRLQAESSYLKDDTVLIRVTCRGKLYYEIKEPLREGIRAFSLSAEELPEGIIAFTLMDQEQHPLAERLYFNQRPETRINIKVSPDKESYSQSEMTKLGIETTDKDGKAVGASLSLLVINKEQLGKIQETRQNILSYFLLSSELRGEIEDPGFYFRGGGDRSEALDALMLTQGWRKYNYTKPVDKIRFQPETNLTVSGKVSGQVSGKTKDGAELTMMTMGKTRTFIKTVTDSLGRFTFRMDDEYGQNLNVLIQSADKKGEKKDYTITLDRKESPAVSFNHIRSIEKPDSIVRTIVTKNIERKSVEDARKLSSGTILLDEVVVEGTQMTAAKKMVTEEYGKPVQVISGKAIQEKEQKWSYGLYSVIKYNFPDKIEIMNFNGTLYARVKGMGMTFIVIDGITVEYSDYPLIPNIPPSEVKSFEIIPFANNFMKLLRATYPYLTAKDEDKILRKVIVGHVIAIYTCAGKGLYGAQQAKGMMKTTVPVFSASREFYAPKHDNPNDWVTPDLRALVHWAPNLKVDSTGRGTASFYNADNTGEMKVVVEAISDKGEIGYRELDYKVVKGNEK